MQNCLLLSKFMIVILMCLFEPVDMQYHYNVVVSHVPNNRQLLRSSVPEEDCFIFNEHIHHSVPWFS